MPDYVTDAVPGAKLRSATPADSLMHVNDDGTVTIPAHVQVVGCGETFCFRSPRLHGWAVVGSSVVVMADPPRAARVAIREEMARQRRVIQRWTPGRAYDHHRREMDYWREADALAAREATDATHNQPVPQRP